MLFDTGPEGAVFLRNCKNMGIKLGDIEHITMTPRPLGSYGSPHGHRQSIKSDKGNVTVHVNPDMFNPRAVKLATGDIVPVQIVPSPAELKSAGATVVNDPAPQLLFDDHVYYSGENSSDHPLLKKAAWTTSAKERPTPLGSPTRCSWTNVWSLFM